MNYITEKLKKLKKPHHITVSPVRAAPNNKSKMSRCCPTIPPITPNPRWTFAVVVVRGEATSHVAVGEGLRVGVLRSLQTNRAHL